MTSHTVMPHCPERSARAPLAPEGAKAPHTRLYLASPALQGAVVAVVCRDTRGVALSDAQRLSHFPATPLVCLSWYHGLDAGLVEPTANGPRWRPFGTSATLSGSQSQPTTSWAPTTGRGGMVCLSADAARALFDLDLATVHDRFACAWACLGEAWWPLLQALLDAESDSAVLAALERHLAPRWLALQGDRSLTSTLRRAGRHWVARLAWQAHEWRRSQSERQVERRIKSFSGRSLREWQTLVRTEGAFFSARDRYDEGQPLDWAALAQDEGFADQAHLSRATKRTTGFAPGEFLQRFIEDESFWVYRLWL
jgi:hypothetical protein